MAPLSRGMSDWEAGVSLAKAIMGAGSFALPWAFSRMGYLAGPLVLAVFLGLSVHSIGLLAECARWLRAKRNGFSSGGGGHSLTYVEVARSAFGPAGALASWVASVSASIGVCGSYLVFVAANLGQLLGNDSSDGGPSIPALVWGVAMPAAVLLSSVRDPKRFAAVSFWGDVSVAAGMLAVLVDGLLAGEHRSGSCVAVGSPRDMAPALGSIGYLFLVHFLVLPIESSMAEGAEKTGERAGSDRHEDRFGAVVRRTFVVCGAVGGGFGVAGYLLFGADTEEIVLMNVGGGPVMALVRFLLCVDLLLTYPVVMRPSIVVLERHCFRHRRPPGRRPLGVPEDPGEDGVALVPSGGVSPASSTCGKRNAIASFEIDEGAETVGHLVDRIPIRENDDDNNDEGVGVIDWRTHMAVCLALGVVAAGAATLVPAFGLLSGLVGGVSQTFLAFVLPPLVWARQRQSTTIAGRSGGTLSPAPAGWSLLGVLPWRERGLVACGFGLILWTLRSAWIELAG